MDAEKLYRVLDHQPWKTNAWACGDWIDAYATGLYVNLKYHNSRRLPSALFGWLLMQANPASGMWGSPTPQDRWLQPVNGFYRLTRATYAQFGVPLPHPGAAIDTMLAHGGDAAFFSEHTGTACNVLDVVHPLWLCSRQVDHRRDEIRAWARVQIERVLGRWQDRRGFSFELERQHAPTLMGTEMWLSILFLLAEVCGASASLGYRPRGVHRLEVAWPLQSR
jgi:hypothetical protein